MKKILLTLAILIIQNNALATPFIMTQANDVHTILTDFQTISKMEAILRSVQTVSLNPRRYKIMTQNLELTKLCSAIVEIKPNRNCVAAPGSSCGSAAIQILSQVCK